VVGPGHTIVAEAMAPEVIGRAADAELANVSSSSWARTRGRRSTDPVNREVRELSRDCDPHQRKRAGLRRSGPKAACSGEPRPGGK
jgi:hypothetical protein